jgi:hypothetical protein
MAELRPGQERCSWRVSERFASLKKCWTGITPAPIKYQQLGKDSMPIQTPAVKMVPVEADSLESVGYVTGVRQLYVKFHNSPTLCFNNVPGFRYEGLLSAPRKDAYYKTFIQNFFISKTVQLPPQI